MNLMKKSGLLSRYFGDFFIPNAISLLGLGVLLGCLCWPSETPARQNSVSGAVSVGPDYNSNVFQADTNRDEEWRSQFAPKLSFSSKGVTDALSLTYAPQFSYNHRREDDEMTQALSLAADKGMSSHWKVTMDANYATFDNLFFEPVQGSMIQSFLRADIATQQVIVESLWPGTIWDPATTSLLQIVQKYDTSSVSTKSYVDSLLAQGLNGSRQRYWTSGMGLNSTYEFAEKSTLSLGYRVANQDNRTGLMADQLSQTPNLLAAYQFNPQWRGEVGYELRRTTYGGGGGALAASEDSTASTPHLQLDFQLSPANLLFWNYNYQLITFDGVLGDNTNQGGHVGWAHNFDQRTALTSSVGSSYLGQELQADEREYSLDLALSRTFDRGTIALSGTAMKALAEATGEWYQSRRSWQLRSTASYQLMQALSSSGHLSYGEWDSWGINASDNAYDRLQLGGGLSYGFARWFTLSMNYDYNLFNTDSAILQDYAEHRVSLRLAANQELWHW